MVWEHDGQCQCGRRTFLFGQCVKCLREEMAEKGRELVERAVEQDSADPPREAEEVAPAGATREVGDPLPVLPLATGEVTRAVAFVTDRKLNGLLREGSQHQLELRLLKWKPGSDSHVPKDGAVARTGW